MTENLRLSRGGGEVLEFNELTLGLNLGGGKPIIIVIIINYWEEENASWCLKKAVTTIQ